MTNIFKRPEKVQLKYRLFEIGAQVLEDEGWTVTKERGLGKSSVRRITRGQVSKLVSIRTTQDQWIAFPPHPNGGWITLDDVDVVLAVSVDASVPPKEALVHWLDGDEMRERFNKAMKARRAAGHDYPKQGKRRGVWLPLYIEDDGSNARYVGGGAGIAHPPIARVKLDGPTPAHPSLVGAAVPPSKLESPSTGVGPGESPIAIAKRYLATALGIPESAVRIVIDM